MYKRKRHIENISCSIEFDKVEQLFVARSTEYEHIIGVGGTPLLAVEDLRQNLTYFKKYLKNQNYTISKLLTKAKKYGKIIV